MTSKLWKKLILSSPLDLKLTLMGGQSFRWNHIADGEFLGVFANILWLLKSEEKFLYFKVLGELPYDDSQKIRFRVEKPKEKSTGKSNTLYHDDYYQNLLKTYFRLDINLKPLYEKWIKAHNHFEKNSEKFSGVIQLNQDPVENLISFICSQNNNIQRISGLVEKICTNYGDKICDYSDKSYYNFPNIDRLAKPDVEQNLRNLGFGYRAKYIQKSAEEIIDKGGIEWFINLQKMSYKECHQELMTLTGIGPKVADCICLMSLNHLEAVPVDTHILQIAENYLPKLREKSKKKISMTPKLYQEIGDTFRDIYKEYSGWAQTVLFCSDLRQFSKDEDEPKIKKKKQTA